MSPYLLLLLPLSLLFSRVSAFPNRCSERCRGIQIPFPFHLNASCGPDIDAFRLSCSSNNSDSLALTLGVGGADLHVIDFLPSGALLVYFPPTAAASASCERRYFDANDSSVFDRNRFYGISAENVLRLYDCEDSSVCKSECEGVVESAGGCEGNGSFSGCCYPLWDGSVWKVGDGFSAFSEFGCRGFTSWLMNRSADGVEVRPGIEVEWAIPREFRNGTICAEGALVVNATVVRGGVRCMCGSGFAGDGFADGVGCLKVIRAGSNCIQHAKKAYTKDGHAEDVNGCCSGKLSKKKVAILAGTLASVFFLAAIAALCAILRRPMRSNKWDIDPACLQKIIEKAYRMRIFTYGELSEAVKGFGKGQKLFGSVNETVYAGVLDDGSPVAVQKINCENEQDFMFALNRVELLSLISHINISRLIGCCIESNNPLLLVHEACPNWTLEELLQLNRVNCLDWYHRINIIADVVNALRYLQFEVCPPIYFYDLKSSDISIGTDYSVKLPGYKLLKSRFGGGFCSYVVSQESHDLCNFGYILLEIIMGPKCVNLANMALRRISDGRFDQIVDPLLGFNELPVVQREQVERVGTLAAWCLSGGGNGKLCIVEVAKELECMVKHNTDNSCRIGSALQETFSTSSLLQMISTSPDSIHAP